MWGASLFVSRFVGQSPFTKVLTMHWRVFTTNMACVELTRELGQCFGGLFNATTKLSWNDFNILLTFFFRDVPTFGIYTVAYEHILCMFKKEHDRSSNTSIKSQIVAGGIAGEKRKVEIWSRRKLLQQLKLNNILAEKKKKFNFSNNCLPMLNILKQKCTFESVHF